MAEWADNYDPFATISYNNLPEEDTINTGSNMTVFIVSEVIESLPLSSPNPYIVGLTSSVILLHPLSEDALIGGQQ